MFRILWLFWQMRDRLPESRAWIEELRHRADALDDRARVELSLICVVTAAEVGDDESALAEVTALERIDSRIDDPSLGSAAQLAISWVRPIVGDLEGALQAALAAHEGLRRQKEPFLGWAALTAGLLELALGRHDAARVHLGEASALGGQLGNHWLRATCANTARLAGRGDGSSRRGSGAAAGVSGGKRGFGAQHASLDLLARRPGPACAGARRPTAGGAGPGCRRGAPGAGGAPDLAVDATERGRPPRGSGGEARSGGDGAGPCGGFPTRSSGCNRARAQRPGRTTLGRARSLWCCRGGRAGGSDESRLAASSPSPRSVEKRRTGGPIPTFGPWQSTGVGSGRSSSQSPRRCSGRASSTWRFTCSSASPVERSFPDTRRSTWPCCS